MKRLAVQIVKQASRNTFGQLPKPQRIPNKRKKLLDKSRRKDEF